jgi:glutathione peroxidase
MTAASIYGFQVKSIMGQEMSLESFRGKTLLIVNVASQCGFTPQYGGLEALYQKYKERGLEILAFPCNQFGGQEPGAESEIENFCKTNYGVSFKLFAKVDVNGATAAPLYKFLKSSAPGLLGTEAIKWNFTKILVDKDGNVLKRYAPTDTPEAIGKELEKIL